MTILYESVKHAYSHVTTPLIPCVIPCWRRGEHVYAVVCSPTGTLPFLGKLQPTCGGHHAANLAQWKVGLSMSRIQNPIWPQTCLRGFRSGLGAVHRRGKHTNAEKPDVPLVVEGSIQHHQFTPLTMATHTLIEGPRLPSVGWMHTSISLSPCLRCTQAWSSLWNSMKQHSSLKTHCLQCLRYNLLNILRRTRRRRLWSKAHLAGRLNWYLAARSLLQCSKLATSPEISG